MPALHPGKVEQFLHNTGETFRFANNDIQLLFPVSSSSDRSSLLKRFRPAFDCRQRGTQFVETDEMKSFFSRSAAEISPPYS